MTDKLRFLEETCHVTPDDERISELADFPEVPEGVLGAPGYFFAVLSRKFELLQEASAARRRARDARAALDRAIAAAGTGDDATTVSNEVRQREADRRRFESEERRIKEESANLEAAKGRIAPKLKRAEIEVRNLSLLAQQKKP